MTNAQATATFKDIWFGDISAALVPFKTTRKGAKVIRYRWQAVKGGQGVGSWVAGGFSTVSGAMLAASRHHCFSNVVEVAV